MQDVENGMLIPSFNIRKTKVTTCKYCEEPIYENEEYTSFMDKDFHNECFKNWLEDNTIRK